jgi:hypothetical protein
MAARSAKRMVQAAPQVQSVHRNSPSTLRSCCFFYQITTEDMTKKGQFRLQSLHGRQTAFRRSSAESLTDEAIVAQKAKWIGFLVEQSDL